VTIRPQFNLSCISVEQRDLWRAAAAAEGVSLTELIRRAVARYLERDVGVRSDEWRMAELGRQVARMADIARGKTE
jgi:hypothetical protein